MVEPVNMSQDNEGLDAFLTNVSKEKLHTGNLIKLNFG
jgi:hypothetical protein